MKNAFKTNSRFAVLAEDTALDTVFTKNSKHIKKGENNEIKREGNSFTSNDDNSFKNYNNQTIRYFNKDFESVKSKELREKHEKEQKEERKKIREEENKKSLSIDNFPDLLENTDNKKNIVIADTTTVLTDFIDKVKFVKPPIEDTNIINHIKPGWIEMKQYPKTKKIITTSNPLYNDENTDNNIGNKVLHSLVVLHEKRSEEYINMWGYETWEKVFTFPNYDYEYFNKLDENKKWKCMKMKVTVRMNYYTN